MKINFLYWYSLSLGLIAISLLAILLQRVVGDPMTWTARIAQYLAGVYFLIAALKAFREAKERGISFGKFIGASFHPAEEKYRALSENSPDMIMRFDRQLKLIYMNPAGVNVFGKAPGENNGSPIREMGIPEPYCGFWEERIKDVFEAGKTEEADESFSAATN